MRTRLTLAFALLALALGGVACDSDYGSSDSGSEQGAASTDSSADKEQARERRRARRLRRARRERRERREARQVAAGDFDGDGVPDADEVDPAPDPEPKPAEKDECHPSYDPCLDPNASDYDCEGGSGDGPEYTGPVTVKGDDPFDLDRDDDGQGCDP